ncbi:MAG: hypothetical protein ABIA63_05325 [bacterium]
MIRISISALLTGLLLLGCMKIHIKAVVQDINGLETEIDKARLAKGNAFYVIDGMARRTIPIKEVDIIKFSSDVLKTINGEIYYQAQVELKDGTKIIPYQLPDGTRSPVFVNIENEIQGDYHSGKFSLDLKDAGVITIIIP